ncbi:hypothetical protein ENH_00030490, partial [Eimeria necatrix]
MCAIATGPNSIPVSPDWEKRLHMGTERKRTEGPDVGKTQQPPADQSHAETTSPIKEWTRRKMDRSGEQNDAATEGDRPQDTDTEELQWWREQKVQEDTTPQGTLCSVGVTAVLRVEVAGNQCEALLDTGASRSFISPGAVERLQLRTRKLPEEHVFTIANGAQLRIDRVVKGLTMWCGTARLAGDFLVGPVPYDLVVGLDWLTTHRVAWYFQSDKLRTYVDGQWCDLPVVRAAEATQRNGSTQGTLEERQGALCCALVETSLSNPRRQCLKALPASAYTDDEETSPWPTAKLEYSNFDTWLNSEEAQETPRVILEVLCANRAVFPDKLPTGLPPKRPHDHRILLVPGKLPAKSAIYRMTPEQLLFHKQEIAKLSTNGWIGPTYSPICAPTTEMQYDREPAMETDVALRLVEERQGALCCALVETSLSNPRRQCLKALPASAYTDDEETSPWPTAKLEYSNFDTWLNSEEAQETPRVILEVLCANRAVFPDKLPTGLPPKRPHDHRILLVPGKLPAKSAIYRMTPEQLLFHKQEIAKLSTNGWIGPTYSPICAPTIMVDKRSDETG